MKKKLNLMTAMLLTLVLTLSLVPCAAAVEDDEAPAAAQTTVDPETDKGSVTLTAKYEGRALSNIEVTLYRVGTGVVENSNLVFVLQDVLKPAADSEEAAVELNGLNAEQTKAALETLLSKIKALPEAERTVLQAGVAKTDDTGKVTFSDLPVGVYLAVQTSDGSYKFDAVMLYLPYTNEEGTAWETEVSASPKISYTSSGGGGGGKDPEPEEIPDPDIPLIPGDPPTDSPENPPMEELPEPEVPTTALPQTGLLQWPAPVMAVAGLLLIAMGILSEQKRRVRGN